MKVELWTFGKEHESYIGEGIGLYTQRIRHYCHFEVKILSTGRKAGKIPSAKLKKQEGDIIERMLTRDHVLISLHEKGKAVTSAGLSELLAAQQMVPKTLVFLIGGAYGMEDRILKRSEKVISLSALTFPHQIVRLIMAEQLYRAFSILHNSPYHHL